MKYCSFNSFHLISFLIFCSLRYVLFCLIPTLAIKISFDIIIFHFIECVECMEKNDFDLMPLFYCNSVVTRNHLALLPYARDPSTNEMSK